MAVFNPQMCLIQDYATKTLKAVGKEAGGLYHLIEEPVTKLDTEATAICNTVLNNALNNCVAMPESVVLAANSQQNNDFHLWHQRLGHASMSRLKYIDCISVKPAGLQRCLTCPMAKFSKLPYSLSDSHCAHILYMIHIDIGGHTGFSHKVNIGIFLLWLMTVVGPLGYTSLHTSHMPFMF